MINNKSIALASIATKEEAIKAIEAEIALLKKTAYPGVLTDNTRDEVAEFIFECIRDNAFGDGMEDDYIWHGMSMVGINDLTDEELVDSLLNLTGEDEGLYQKAMGELILEKVLAGESVDE